MKNAPSYIPRRYRTPDFPSIEWVMNGGFVEGTVTILYAAPGIGKTTLSLQLCDKMSQLATCLYNTSEQTVSHLKSVALRIGIAGSSMMVAQETSMDALIHVLRQFTPKIHFIVIDSLSNMAAGDLVAPTATLCEIARETGIAILALLHETKDGDYNAPRRVEHLVDAMVTMQQAGDHFFWRSVGKYRYGPVGRTAKFWKDETGVFHE
jgi:DNA repair protein RadA/Sms